MAAVCVVSLLGAVLWLAWHSQQVGNQNRMGLKLTRAEGPRATAGWGFTAFVFFDITNAPLDSLGRVDFFIQESNRWILQPQKKSGVGFYASAEPVTPASAFVLLDSTNVPIRLVLECRGRASSSFGRFVEEIVTQIDGRLSGNYLPKHFGRRHRVTNDFNLHLLGDSQPR